MKIGFVSPYDFLSPGGVNRHIIGLSEELTRKGHSVKIIGIASGKFKLQTEVEFINLGNYLPFSYGGTTSNISLSPLILLKIKNVFKKYHFDVIHIHEPLAPLVSLGALFFCKSPVVATFHASSKNVFRYKVISKIFKNLIENKIYQKIAVSKEALRTASEYIPGKFEIIPNGIDHSHFSKLDNITKFNFGKQKKNILFFGRNEPRKGISILLKAFSILRLKGKNFRLILAGPDTDKINISEYLDYRFLEDVICVGEVDYNLLPKYFYSSDCFCSPAIGNESFGIVILEAMASSLPVVVSDISGYNELIIDGERGVLFKKENSEDLAVKLDKVLGNSNYSEKLIKEGNIFSKKHDWKNLVELILNKYEEVVFRKGNKNEY